MNCLNIAIAYCDQGKGHKNRQEIFAQQLREEGHNVFLVNEQVDLFGWTANYDGLSMNRGKTLVNNIINASQKFIPSIIEVRKLLRDFEIDYGVVDFQPSFTVAARSLNIPLISFDHQHALTHLDIPLPRATLKELLARTIIPSLHSEHYIVTNFFPSTIKENLEEKTTLVGPILRDDVLNAETGNEDFLVFYATDPSASKDLEELAFAIERDIYFFNSGKTGVERNIQFKDVNGEEFSQMLAKSSGLVSNAGNNATGEALYHQTPVFGLPLDQFEQEANSLNIKLKGYGHTPLQENSVEAFKEFLERLPEYRENIQRDKHFFNGNSQLKQAFRNAVSKIEEKREQRLFSCSVQTQLI